MQHLKIKPESNKTSISGNISIISLISIAVVAFIFFILTDICRIFIIREMTKNTADAIALSCAQDILFFEVDKTESLAQDMAERNSCKLLEIKIFYDRVFVSVEKELHFVMLKSFYPEGCTISSSSSATVIFPWDESFEYCDSYLFSY